MNGTFINSFDSFVQRTSDSALLSTLTTADRIAAITSDNISWTGALGTAANGSVAPALYAPNPVEPGSSYSHLDETTFPLELMSPIATAGTGHTLSPLTLAILEDQGWTIVPEPSAALLLLILAGACAVRRHRFSA